MANSRTFYAVAKSKRAARRVAHADPRWERTWQSDRQMALMLASRFGGRVYSFTVTADPDSVELVKEEWPNVDGPR